MTKLRTRALVWGGKTPLTRVSQQHRRAARGGRVEVMQPDSAALRYQAPAVLI